MKMQIPKTKKYVNIPVYNDDCTVSSNQSEIFVMMIETGENEKYRERNEVFCSSQHAAFFGLING
jgi:hypothetical protein